MSDDFSMTRTPFRSLPSPRAHTLAVRRFHFADALWFRIPLKLLVIGLTVFALFCLYPALGDQSVVNHARLAFAFATMACFIAMASIFMVAINESHVDLSGHCIDVTFESFFHARIPLADIVSVEMIDPRPRWRYRFGLSTNFRDRVTCSHGGKLIEIVLSEPQETHLWPRQLAVSRFWLAVCEPDEFIDALRIAAPQAFDLVQASAA